jgi:DNA sulfur modification protein DndD
MIIRSVEMNNFMPYVGQQQVSFDTSKDHPVVLIYGENNRGKSSLFASVKWAMYGEVIDRTGRKWLEENLLNDSAFDEGERSFGVTLALESDGDSYLIQRTAEVSTDQNGNRISSKQKVVMRKNSNFVEHVEIQPTINQIMNKEISIFFLCDMEVLEDYEKLVKDDNLAAEGIKSAIEDILGVPAIVAVREALKSVSSEAYAEIKKNSDSSKESTRIQNEITLEEEKFRKAKSELAKAISRHKEKEKEKESLDKLLAKHEQSSELIGIERTLIDQESSDLKEIERLRTEIQLAMRESWWLPISHLVESKYAETQNATEIAASRNSTLAAKNSRLSALTESLESGSCGECGQGIPEAKRSEIQQQIEKLKQDIAELQIPMVPSLESLMEESKRLARFRVPPKAALIRSHEKSIRLMLNENMKRRQRLNDIAKQLDGIDKSEVQQLNAKRHTVSSEIGITMVAIKTENTKAVEAEKEIAALQSKFSKLQSVVDVNEVTVEHAVSSYLAMIFEKSVQNFRETTKREVEKAASEIFKKLVSKNAFSNLEINENYGLRLVDDAGRSFDHRGAGVEQVVALSLILALGRKAVRSGCLVLDTPFARLDDVHRDNILHYLPLESEQVILLLQSGEKLSTKSSENLLPRVSNRYQITIGKSPKESFIRKAI